MRAPLVLSTLAAGAAALVVCTGPAAVAAPDAVATPSFRGVALPAGEVFADGSVVQVEYRFRGEVGRASTVVTGGLAGASFVPWSALPGLPEDSCVIELGVTGVHVDTTVLPVCGVGTNAPDAEVVGPTQTDPQDVPTTSAQVPGTTTETPVVPGHDATTSDVPTTTTSDVPTSRPDTASHGSLSVTVPQTPSGGASDPGAQAGRPSTTATGSTRAAVPAHRASSPRTADAPHRLASTGAPAAALAVVAAVLALGGAAAVGLSRRATR